MVSEQPLVTLNNISLQLSGRQILSDIDLQLGPKEILTLIGPNGAGKTSLLRVALGLLKPTAGTVSRRSGLRIGYMPQKLLPDATFPIDVQRFLNLADRRSHERISSVLQEVGAEHLLHAQLAGLSGGELQRVLLARALLRDPQLLVLDEPIQGVDVHGQVELFKLITELRQRRNCSVLMVSHDLHLVMAATDRVVCLNTHICCKGTPASVSRDQRFIDLFGPVVTSHLALYTHDEAHQHELCASQSGDCSHLTEDRDD